MQVTESNFSFKAEDYELVFDFFGSVDADKSSWKVGARDVAFVLTRKEEGDYWDKLQKGAVGCWGIWRLGVVVSVFFQSALCATAAGQAAVCRSSFIRGCEWVPGDKESAVQIGLLRSRPLVLFS